ncbi:uncharacterized protein LOC117321425 [Pecten maximus]|uniref:uncharacterized protein LOC117321425 n=1 Tax=Pecten maximus TaxID=6579 RepID=UPI00145850DF|nr:uncharacterized protein LOC117321425 [Pecten maximus]
MSDKPSLLSETDGSNFSDEFEETRDFSHDIVMDSLSEDEKRPPIKRRFKERFRNIEATYLNPSSSFRTDSSNSNRKSQSKKNDRVDINNETPAGSSSRSTHVYVRTPVGHRSSRSPGSGQSSSRKATPDRITPDSNMIDQRLVKLEAEITAMKTIQLEILKTQKEILSKVSNVDAAKKMSKQKTNVNISNSIRSGVRDAYKDGKENGLDWTLYKEEEAMRPHYDVNKEMTSHIKTFVLGVYPDTADAVIRDDTKLYFNIADKMQLKSVNGLKNGKCH